MKIRLSPAYIQVLFFIVCFVVLCGFEDVRNGSVLELPSATRQNKAPSPANPPIEYNDSAAPIPSGPDLRFHQLLKFFGCWQSTVTPKDLTTFANTGSAGPQKWTNQRYEICFDRDLAGELQPGVSQTSEDGENFHDDRGSTELSGYDEQVVSLLNHQTFAYAETGGNPAKTHWYSFGRASKPVEIEQLTKISCLRDGLTLICTATGSAKCGGKNCYTFSWKATFYGS